MSRHKFKDIEVGDVVTLRIPIKFHRNTEVTGVVEWVSHPSSFDSGIRIHGFVNPLYEHDVSLRHLEKKPLVFPEVGRPIKIWNAYWEKTTTCYGFWDGKSYIGTACDPASGEVKQLMWDIESIEAPRSIRWEYLDGGE